MRTRHFATLAEAFLILDKYYPHGDTYAEHDIIYAIGSPYVMSNEDGDLMNELGWIADVDNERWFFYT